MPKIVFNLNVNFQGTKRRKKKTKQPMIDTLKDMKSAIIEWKKFLMLSPESLFQESCTISWKEFREEILMHKEPATEKQGL